MQPRKIIRNREIVDDSFVYVSEADQIPADGDIIVDVSLWNDNKETLKQRDGRVGIQVTGEAEPEVFADDLQRLDVIAVNFPVFRDGRGYSLARILRDRLGYDGELRATGDVLRDQLFYLQRCGFNSFEPRTDRCIEDALNGLSDFSVTYQADANDKRPIYRRRPS